MPSAQPPTARSPRNDSRIGRVYPPIEPFQSGMLTRPDGDEIYWEASGSADGTPALYLHGGPGGGLGKGGYRRRFDPERFLIIGLDQRGCGRSRPLAVEGGTDRNTTQALIDDIESLRSHLGVEHWLVHGVSWGSTLALAYALEHRERVQALVLMAVTTGSREEVDWLTHGVGRLFPEAWSRFARLAQPGERVVDAYVRALKDEDPAVRWEAAASWNEWEATHVSLDPRFTTGAGVGAACHDENFARLVSWYWANDCFLTGKRRILGRAHLLREIPGVLIHGRHDISGPAVTPWLLHRAWPGSVLHIVEDEGHGGSRMLQLAVSAIARLG